MESAHSLTDARLQRFLHSGIDNNHQKGNLFSGQNTNAPV